MPHLKNLQTGHSHVVSMAMWKAVWEERCKKFPEKYQLVVPQTMNLTDISIPFVEDKVKDAPILEEVVEEQGVYFDEFDKVFLVNQVTSIAPKEVLTEISKKKRGRPRKV